MQKLEKEESTYTEKTSSSSTDLLQFRPTSTLAEEDRYTNSLLHCYDDIPSIKLLLEVTKSELQWIQESLLKKHLCGTKLQDRRQGYNCCDRNELATLTEQRTA